MKGAKKVAENDEEIQKQLLNEVRILQIQQEALDAKILYLDQKQIYEQKDLEETLNVFSRKY